MKEIERHNLELQISGMDCSADAIDIEKAVQTLPGIKNVQVNYLNQKAKVFFDETKTNNEQIVQVIQEKTPYRASAIGAPIQPEKEKGNYLKWILYCSAILFGIGLLGKFIDLSENIRNILFALSLIILTLSIALKAFKRFKANPFNADILMSLAGIGSFLIGHYAEGAAVLLLYTLAELLEAYTVDRVRKTTKKLAELLPKRALLKKGDSLEEVLVEDLAVGDIIIVKPGWRLPIDGVIISGSSSIDQAAVTGESVPVEKKAGNEILSGTINLDGSLEVRVTKLFYDSTTNRIINLVMEAQGRKASIEKFVDQFSRYYTPAMLVLTGVVALVPPLFFNQSFSIWFYRSLIVLIIACPSAFLISTPVTVLVGLTTAMRNGVLIKGGAYLEALAKIQAVIFDKTGTLTIGKPSVVGIEVLKDHTEEEVLLFAAIAEEKSSHPLALAIIQKAKDANLQIPNAHIEEINGKGVKALFEGKEILVGKLAFLKELDISIENIATGNTYSQIGVAVNKKLIGVIHIADTKRPEAKEALLQLKRMGIKEIVMLTGDQEQVAKQMAKEIGLETYYAGLLPQDKERIAKELRKKYGSVAMVGDGINDAPVLAASNVGIAIGTAGNDIALEAADVALMGSDLRAVPFLIKLGKKSVNKLHMNLGIALGLKGLMIVLGVLGIIPLWVAVLGDDGATLIVIANALPLLRTKLQK